MEDERKVAWEMIRVGMASVSTTCIFCFQDILSLGTDARMNTPGIADGALPAPLCNASTRANCVKHATDVMRGTGREGKRRALKH
jgi:4-alpha-glucanotransferase